MIIRELAELLGLTVITGEIGLDNDIRGCYVCDLLSWVIANAQKSNIWITIHTNINIVAVAVLLELSCIIIPENIDIDSTTVEKANLEGIPILSSKLSSFELSKKIGSVGI